MIDENFNGLLRVDEIPAFRDATATQAARCIRLRLDRMDSSLRSSLALDLVPWFDRGRILRDASQRPSQSLRYAAADYFIQDAGSLLALALLDAQSDEAICDLCAAPGGKASGIGESLRERGFLLANEPIRPRAAVLRYALSRTGNPRHAITQQDPEQIANRFEGLFDAVLVDAPCSGQTMVARRKREANAFDRKQVEHSAGRQRRILLAACRLLKPGGRLIYSTCTFAVEENESQIQFLRNRFPNCFEPILVPSLERWASPVEPGCYRLWPHRDPTSGAFAAGLKLNESVPNEGNGKKKVILGDGRLRQSSSNGQRFDVFEAMAEFGRLDQLQTCESDRGEACGIPNDAPTEIVRRLDAREWPKLANCRNGVWKPEYLLAMLDRMWFDPNRNLEISHHQARKYMRGEALFLDIGDSGPVELAGKDTEIVGQKSRWTVIHWQGKPLGWAKLAGNRANNHLPAQAILPIGDSEEFTL